MVSGVNYVLPYTDKSLLEAGIYCHASTTDLTTRVVRRYSLCNREDATYQGTTRALTGFLNDNPSLCATFSMETLKEKIRKNPYLIVNGFSVNLTKNLDGEKKAEYKDRYFTEQLLKHPIRCSKGHLLENKRVSFWQKKYPDTCPAGSDHGIQSLQIDSELEDDIFTYRQNRRRKEKSAQEEHMSYQQTLYQFRGRVNPLTSFGTSVKLIVKSAGKSICFKVCRLLIKSSSHKVALTIAKKIPLLSAFIGLGLGMYRITQGERYKAAGECLSGAFGCLPGIGTLASFAIDTALIADDIYKAFHPDLATSYLSLGINPAKNPNPTQKQVDHAFRTLLDLFHPDPFHKLGEKWETICTNVSTKANIAKAFIYEKRGWILNNSTPPNVKPPINPHALSNSYSVLGIANSNPTQNEVDNAFSVQQNEVNLLSTLLGLGLEEEEKQQFSLILSKITEARNFIYLQRNWTLNTI